MFNRQRLEWCKWVWGVVRPELTKYHISFWRWPQAAGLVARFMWRAARVDMNATPEVALEIMRGAPKVSVSK